MRNYSGEGRGPGLVEKRKGRQGKKGRERRKWVQCLSKNLEKCMIKACWDTCCAVEK